MVKWLRTVMTERLFPRVTTVAKGDAFVIYVQYSLEACECNGTNLGV